MSCCDALPCLGGLAHLGSFVIRTGQLGLKATGTPLQQVNFLMSDCSYINSCCCWTSGMLAARSEHCTGSNPELYVPDP